MSGYGRETKLEHLEKSWNSNVSIRPDQKRLLQMSQDIKHFIIKSMSDPQETQKVIDQSNRAREDSMDTFQQISSTLGFVHREGTDRSLELKVVKVIMIREGLLSSLRFLVESAHKTNSLNGTNILETLAQLREKTLNYLEALCLWRQSSTLGSQPLMFIWEHQNYTMKLINDMDFLADSNIVINTLKIPPHQLRCNPLMLSNNLEDPNTWMDPYERAVLDTGGHTSGNEFESRLRLRFAERILLQEIEINNNSNSQILLQQEDQSLQGNVIMIGSNALEEVYSTDGMGKDFGSNDSINSEHSAQNFPQSRSSTVPSEFERFTPFDGAADYYSSNLGYGNEYYSGNWEDMPKSFNENEFAEKHFSVALEKYDSAGNMEQASSVRSMRSVDSVCESDVAAITTLKMPPKSAVLTGSIIIILLSKENKIPIDLSWKAFSKLCRVGGLAEKMNCLEPDQIPKFKIVAIQPMLEELVEDSLLSSSDKNMNVPLAGFIAMNKLIVWAKQFATSALKRQKRTQVTSSPKKKAQLKQAIVATVPILAKKTELLPLSDTPKTKEVYGSKVNSSGNRANLDGAPSKKAIPKVKMDLIPLHTEMIQGVLKNPLLLIVLTSPTESSNNSKQEYQRIVLKIYDTVSSKEAFVHINEREYTLFVQELEAQISPKINEVFRPLHADWWIQHSSKVIQIHEKHGNLKADVSKRLVRELVSRLYAEVQQKGKSSGLRASSSDRKLKNSIPTHFTSADKMEKNSIPRKQIKSEKGKEMPLDAHRTIVENREKEFTESEVNSAHVIIEEEITPNVIANNQESSEDVESRVIVILADNSDKSPQETSVVAQECKLDFNYTQDNELPLMEPSPRPITSNEEVVSQENRMQYMEPPNKSIVTNPDSLILGNENISDYLLDAPDESTLRIEDSEEKTADFQNFVASPVNLREIAPAPVSIPDGKSLSYVSDFDSEGGNELYSKTWESQVKESAASLYEEDFDVSSHIQSKADAHENLDSCEPVKRSKNQEDDIREESLANRDGGSNSYYEDFDDVDEEIFEV